MALDLESLLAPVSGESATGIDLTYENDRVALEQAFERPVSADSAGNPAQRANYDWKTAIAQIGDQLAKSKDLWLAVYLCRSGAEAQDTATVALGADTLVGLLERYWDGVHPQLQEVGLQGRKTACDSLGHRSTFLESLVKIPIISHPRFGVFSGADCERLAKGRDAEPDFAPFQAALAETGEAPLKKASAFYAQLDNALRRADQIFSEKAGGELRLDLDQAYEILARLRKAIANFQSAPEQVGDANSIAANDVAGQIGGSVVGRIETREGVIGALEAIADYYRRKEPSSPIPLLVERAKAWVTMPFLDVLSDIAPAGIDDAKKVLTRRPSE